MIEISIDQNSCIDGDGNVYSTVKIGTQLWMQENLKTTKYNNGTSITFVDDEDAEPGVWEDLSTEAYSRGGPDGTAADDNYEDTYGFLYNWYAIETGNLAPVGWKAATDADWTILKDFITSEGYTGIEGNALKEVGYEHWTDSDDPTENGTDIYGFTALPGGYRSGINGKYYFMDDFGYFLTSTESSSVLVLSRRMYYNNSIINRFTSFKQYGYSVRCIRDETNTGEISMTSQAMSGISITIPPSYASSDRWDTFGIPWNVSKEYWAIT